MATFSKTGHKGRHTDQIGTQTDGPSQNGE